MDFGKLLKEAYEITLKNKVLWLFGFLATITGGGFSSGSYNANFSSSRQVQTPSLPHIEPSFLLVSIILISLIVLILIVVFITINFVARASLMGMVSEIKKGETPGIKQGFSIGFSKWFRLFLVSLVIFIPMFLGIVALMGVLAIPGIIVLILKNLVLAIAFFVLGALVAIAIIIPVAIVLGIINELAGRFSVLNDRPVFDSISAGYTLLKDNLGQWIIFWLIIVAIGIAVGLAMLVVALVLILPVIFLSTINWVFLIFLLPGILVFLFISSLVQTFTSAFWTLAFQELVPADSSGK